MVLRVTAVLPGARISEWYCQPGSEGFSLTAEQLEASRSERMRQNGLGAQTIEDARTWLEETGLCLFLPKKQFSPFVAPSFVEAVAGERNPAPSAKAIALAEDLLVRLELDGVAVRLNLLGTPGEQPDFVVAAWVLPYVYALRGDRDWRRSPQLTGSRQVSQLAIQAYKLLEAGDATIPQLKHALGREVSETAVLRAITELWQQLRIIPVISAPGKTPQWQLLRLRFQKAIAEGASTSQVTAISVLASIYLQAVIAASMEEVELFLAPLTARSKVREVLRGLVATRQVHTLSLGHAPHFYVAGTLPEFAAPPTVYASSSMPASSNFLRSYEREEEVRAAISLKPFSAVPSFQSSAPKPAPVPAAAPAPSLAAPSASASAPAPAAAQKPTGNVKPPAGPPHFTRPSAHPHARKPAASSAGSRMARHAGRNGHGATRHSNGTARHAQKSRWQQGAQKNGHNGSHAAKSSNGSSRLHSNGSARPSRPSSGNQARHSQKSSPARSSRTGRMVTGKAAAKPSSRRSTGLRKDVRSDARGSRKPALAASAKAGNRARYGFTAPRGQRSKKRG
jgi:23S rRNA pseudouridine2605 synthase